jgi:hypothetical protein
MAAYQANGRHVGCPIAAIRWRWHSLLYWLLLMLLALLAGCSQGGGPTHAVARATRTSVVPTPTYAVNHVLGPIPQDCPPGPTPQSISPNLTDVVGGSPVWLTPVTGIPSSVPFTQFGWPDKVIWEVEPSYTEQIMVHGGSLRDGTQLWIELNNAHPTTTAVLDPQNPGHDPSVVGNGWAEWGSYIYIPKADCYYLEATWPEGHWYLTFAAGALPGH